MRTDVTCVKGLKHGLVSNYSTVLKETKKLYYPAVIQAVTCRGLFTVHSTGICGELVGTWTRLSLSTSASAFPLAFHQFYIWGMTSEPLQSLSASEPQSRHTLGLKTVPQVSRLFSHNFNQNVSRMKLEGCSPPSHRGKV